MPLPIHAHEHHHLPITLRHALQLVLLFDRITVAASLGRIDQLFCQTLGNALDISESGFTGADGEQSNGLVDAAERRDINGLATNGTGGANAGAIFSRSAVDNGVNSNLDRVLVRHDVDLDVWK